MATEKKKLSSLIRFHSASKIHNNYNGVGWGVGAGRKKRKGKKKSKRIYRTSQKIRIVKVFPESLL